MQFSITFPHFDEARKILGDFTVILLYIPFWGLLEGFWISYLISLVSTSLNPNEVASWKGLLIASLIFGILHVFVNLALGSTFMASLPYLLVSFTLFIAGSIFAISKNSLGTILFWVVFNF